MKIFDFNIHLPSCLKDNPHLLSDETCLDPEELAANYEIHLSSLKSNVNAANFMLLNPELFFDHDLCAFMNRVTNDFPGSTFTSLFNFRRKDVVDALDSAADQGVRGLKFHSYFQKITDEDFSAALALARRAQAHGMFVCVDTSFGTSGMYRYDNMKLACLLADELTCPIILLHSGGLRVLEAMLLAEEKPHVFLETSFSIDYYKGSTIDQDLGFAYRKIGAGRILFGSDFPYMNMTSSLDSCLDLMKRIGFSTASIESIMYRNVTDLVSYPKL